MDTQFNRIKIKFGGLRPMARMIGKAPSTVQTWSESGFIPSKHHDGILRIARENGIRLTHQDFFSEDAA